MSRTALAILTLASLRLFAQDAEPWNNRAYRQDFDGFISDGQYAEGEAAARKAIRKAEQETGAESIHTALAWDMLTEVYFYGDRLRDPAAEDSALRAIAIKQKVFGPDHPQVAVSFRMAGHLMDARGDYERARKFYEETERIYHKMAGRQTSEYDLRQEAAGLAAYASLLAKTGDYTESKAAFEEALAIRLKNFAVETYNTADVMISYATLLRDMGAYQESRSYFLRGLAIQEKKAGADHLVNTRGMNDMGALLNLMGKSAEAAPLLERAVGIGEKAYGPDHVELAFILNNLAVSRTALGDLTGARKLYERAIAIAVNVYGEDHPEVARFLSGYANVLLRLGERQLAFEAAVRTEKIGRAHVALTIRSLPERQALLYATTRPSGLDVALAAAVSDPALRRRALDEVIRSRALVFDEMAARRRAVGRAQDPANAALWDALSEARQRLSRLVVQGPESFKAQDYAAALRRARQENEAAERSLAERSAAFHSLRARSAAGLDEVAGALQADDALVSFVRYGASPVYAAFVQRPGQETQLIRLGAAARVESLVAEVRKQVLAEAENPGVSPKRAETLYRAAGDLLRRQVWDPLEPALARSRRVFLTPVVALNLVDFGALPAKSEGYLAEHGPLLHYLSTERDAVLEAAAKSGSGLLALGNPSVNTPARSFDRAAVKVLRGETSPCLDFASMRFAALPASALEVRDIAAVWRESGQGEAVERTGEAANESAFKSGSAGKRVVHVAAHAFFLGNGCRTAAAAAAVENPLLLSGFALAGANRRRADGEDGIVTAEEIAAMDLSGVEWAVLSGCETGVGKLLAGEGVFGLRRAFQMAGSRTVIMSLWPVDDQATRGWMKTLYREHLMKGKGTAESVRAASLSALAKRRAAGLSTHPFYWAGFIAAGDWR